MPRTQLLPKAYANFFIGWKDGRVPGSSQEQGAGDRLATAFSHLPPAENQWDGPYTERHMCKTLLVQATFLRTLAAP